MFANRSTTHILVFALALLTATFLNSCRHEKYTLPQLQGSWTQQSNPPSTALLATGTGLIGLSPSSQGTSPNRTADTIWYSADHGTSWNIVLNPSPGQAITIQVNLINNMNVVAYSEMDSTFYISQNGGQTWSVLNHLTHNLDAVGPVITDTAAAAVDSILDSAVFYQATFFGVSNNRLFAQKNFYAGYFNAYFGYPIRTSLLESDNNGNTWDTVYKTFYESGYPIELFGIGNTLVQFTYGQVLGSYDNGATWSIFNGSSPVTFPGGVVTDGAAIGVDANNNSIYLSQDTAKNWTQVFHDAYGSLGPVLAFDSVVMASAYYLGAWHILAGNPEKTIDWYAADAGIALYGSYTNLYVDNEYVYAYITGGGFYRRPRTDFKNL